MTTATTTDYEVISPIAAERRYEAGETIALMPAEATPLLALGVVAEQRSHNKAPKSAHGTAGQDSKDSKHSKGSKGSKHKKPRSKKDRHNDTDQQAGEGVDDNDDESASAARHHQIMAAIGELDKTNPDHWTREGLPQVVAIEAKLGHNITAAERDAAWADAG